MLNGVFCKRKFTILLVLCAALIGLVGCSDKKEEPVRISLHVWPGYDTLVLARDKGFFSDDSVKLIEVPSASESIRAFRNRTVDGALLTVDEVLRLADTGHDPVIILIMDFSNGADAVIARQGITDLSLLKGRSIGLEPNALGAYVLARALDTASLSAADVTTVSMPIGETEAAFTEGRVDAVVTYEPYRSSIEESGGIPLFDSSQIPGEIADVLVVHRDIIERSPKSLQQLVDAQFEALSFLSENQSEAASIMAKREGISSAQLLDSLTRLELPKRDVNQRLLSPSDKTIPGTVRALSIVMLNQKILQSDVSNREYRDDRFVRLSSE